MTRGIQGIRGGAMVGLLALGGCIVTNPMYVGPTDSEASTWASTGATTTSDTMTTTVSDGSSTAASEPTSTGMTTSTSMTSMPSTTMPPGVCGDGELNPGEECDDGNLKPLDGCSEKCRLPGCGDGVAEGPEECDDGDDDDDDECLNACKQATCGDGKVFAGVEECDDGNLSDEDGCRNDCSQAYCGDGVVNVGVEDCDDGNEALTDECLNCKKAVCGDGAVWAGYEECDDGNDQVDDFCADCKDVLKYRLVFLTSVKYSGKMGGLDAADQQCQSLAAAAKLKGTFLAWLGTKDTWPEKRMTKSSVPYRRTDYVAVAQNWADLIDGTLAAPIDHFETGAMAPIVIGPCGMGPVVHSNITSGGVLYDLEGNCGAWDSDVGMTSAGQLGMPMPGVWSSGCSIKCDYKAPIYCVQQ